MQADDDPLAVLLVEDNPNDAHLIRRHLGGTESAFLPGEVEISHCEALDPALEVAESERVDLVLLDLGLPESSGAETFDRASEALAEYPIVVLTNLRDEETAVDLLQRGAQDYINKASLSEEVLVKAVRYALEREERERELRRTTEQLEVLSRIMRHDIQNDIQVVRMWSEALAERVDEPHVADVERIVETSDHILELTDNSRELIRAFTDDAALETDPIRLDAALTDEVAKARRNYDAATIEFDDDPPAVAVAANELLRSVFRNLLNNAVQHTGASPTVTVTLARPDEDTARVTVVDDGPGVPADSREEIFGKGAHGLESEGTGIGLYLAHTLVAKFGGEVRVTDREDGNDGARFVVDLPTVEPGDWTAGV